MKCILDLRSSEITAFLELSSVEIICPSNKEISKIKLVFESSNPERYYKWVSTLFLHANLKLAGLEGKDYYPISPNSPASSGSQSCPAIMLQDLVYFNAPSKHHSPLAEDNRKNSSYLQTWTKSTAILRHSGTLEIVDATTCSTLYKTNINHIISSNISQLDNSIYNDPKVLSIDYNCPDFFSFDQRFGVEDHLNSSVHLKFENEKMLSNWLCTLKSLARFHVYAPSTGNAFQSVRVSRVINIRVIEAKLQPRNTNDNLSHAYVEISYMNQVKGKTSMAKCNKCPFWREDFKYSNISSHAIPIFSFRVLGRHDINQNNETLLGHVILDHDDFKDNGDVETWYKFESDYGTGMLGLKISVEEILVTHSSYYESLKIAMDELPFVELRHLLKTEEFVPRAGIVSLNDLCLNVTLAKPSMQLATKWICSLITSEIDKIHRFMIERQGPTCFHTRCNSTQEEFKKNINNSLFRGNSLLTRSLERFMRLIGHDHLHKTIGTFVKSFIERNPSLEIDPSKIAVKEGDQNVENIIKSNQQELMESTNQLWKLIQSVIDDIPISFILIFHHLKKELTTKLNQSDGTIHSYVAGFLFLRYFCPGLLNPKLFGFTSQRQNSNVQRSLTLVTKLLMGFANGTRFGLKEPWMIPLNEFIDKNEASLISYFEKITLNDSDQDNLRRLEKLNSTNDSFANISIEYRPLCEAVNNMLMLDENTNFAHLLRVWDEYIRPKQTEILAKLERISELPESTTNYKKIAKLFQICESANASVATVISDLLDKSEEFEISLVPAYCDHIQLSWIRDGRALSLKPGIKPGLDWYKQNSNSLLSKESLSSIIPPTSASEFIVHSAGNQNHLDTYEPRSFSQNEGEENDLEKNTSIASEKRNSTLQQNLV